tara:strand:- start:211 stop:1452 length:1242 start_codon:yes stop_codon:yes gene_type:complete
MSSEYRDIEERFAEGLSPQEFDLFEQMTAEQRKEAMVRAGVLRDDMAQGGNVLDPELNYILNKRKNMAEGGVLSGRNKMFTGGPARGPSEDAAHEAAGIGSYGPEGDVTRDRQRREQAAVDANATTTSDTGTGTGTGTGNGTGTGTGITTASDSTTADVTTDVKQKSFLETLGGMFKRTPKTEEEKAYDNLFGNFLSYDKTKIANKLNAIDPSITSLKDLSLDQLNQIADEGDLSLSEIKDMITGKIDAFTQDPLNESIKTGYDLTTGATLGATGIANLGMAGAVYNVLDTFNPFTDKKYNLKNPDNFDEEGNYTKSVANLNSSQMDQLNKTQPGGVTPEQVATYAKSLMDKEEDRQNTRKNDEVGVLASQKTQQTVADPTAGYTADQSAKYAELISLGYSPEYANMYIGQMV